jgi:hypothetical protein
MKTPLCIDIEQALGKELKTPKDFEMLHECIYDRLHIQISATTLKRVWQYLDDGVQSRQGTLDILARFIGYRSYEDYEVNASTYKNEAQSSPVMSRKLNVEEELESGDRVRITWHPDRICDVTYHGGLNFSVDDSRNTRIKEGNTFRCSLFIEGEPLYIDNLIQENRPPVAYVCGKKSGIRFERIASDDNKKNEH